MLLGFGIGLGVSGAFDIANSFSKRVALRDLHTQLVAQHGTRPSGLLVEETEREWASHARRARLLRRWATGVGIGVGAIGLATGVGFALTASPGNPRDDGRGSASALLIGLSGVLLAGCVHGWLTAWPDERYYEGYVRASGRVAVSAGVSPLPGGAALSLTGRF